MRASLGQSISEDRPVSTPRVPSASRFLVGGLIVAAGATVLALLVDWAQVQNALTEFRASPLLLAVLIAAYTGAFLLRAIAWRALLTHKTDLYTPFAALQASLFANHILPLKLGEFARPMLAQRRGIPLAQAAVTTAVARTLDFSSLILIACVLGAALALAGGQWLWVQGLALPAAALAGVGLMPIVLRWRRIQDLLPSPMRSAVGAFQDQLASVSAGRVLRAAAWTLPSWMLEATVVFIAARALGIELSVAAAIVVTAYTILFQVFHVTPGGIGMYEAVMTFALHEHGVALDDALTLAVLTHGLKFAYSYTFAPGFSLLALADLSVLNPLKKLRGSSDGAKSASNFELVAARLWNVLNEGKPFTPVFVLGIIGLLSLPHLTDGGYWPRAGVALLALTPLFLVFYRFDFPLKLRVALWVYLVLFLGAFRYVDAVAVALVLGVYLTFTIFLWGSVYYHLRIGTPWTNFTRFWRLVLENPDPTSGNFLEQIPKTLLLVLTFQMIVERPGVTTLVAVEGWILALAVTALLFHQWFFTWPPAPSLAPTRLRAEAGARRCKRFIAIVIDGCRTDRLLEADTPYIDQVRAAGVDYVNTSTVYPARTVTGFSSMFTGAPPKVHGMRSNFVPSLGVKCETIFEALADSGMNGKLVGIAHLVDAFGHEHLETVTAVTHNDDIDNALISRARAVMEREEPDLLAVQLLSVDQTGHARGSYNSEYLEKIEISDRIIREFLDWCREKGYMEEATVLITSDHGQGIGIGGHGHMSKTETYVPCIMWGAGVELSGQIDEPRSVMDVTATIAYFLGCRPPSQSVGQVLGIPDDEGSRPLAVVIPAYNEAENLPDTLTRIRALQLAGARIIVVDDGSRDATGDVAYEYGADFVVRHEQNRGLGAALRTGLATARDIDARAAVYIDADGEYSPSQIPDLLAPIDAGEADYVLGSRYLGTRENQPLLRRAGNLVFTGMLCLAAGRRITDGQTGLRAFSRRALECAEIIHDYNYAQVLTLDLLKKGMRLREIPISHRQRTKGRSFIGPKYLWRVPVGMIREMLST